VTHDNHLDHGNNNYEALQTDFPRHGRHCRRAAVAGAGVYGLTGLYEGSAEASETTDDVVEMSGGANAELDGVNSPEATKLTPFKDALHLILRG